MRLQPLFPLVLALASAPLAHGAAPDATADASLVKGAIGNTILETYPDGRKAEIWLSAGGAYTGEGRKHDKSAGRWSVKGDQLCFHQSHPFAFGQSFCTPIPKVGLGQPWQAKAFTGEQITVKVLPGHVVPS
jgi:hypothetical protein